MKYINIILKFIITIFVGSVILSDIIYSNNYPIYSIIILAILVTYYVISPKIR
jgi:hypothetical protein